MVKNLKLVVILLLVSLLLLGCYPGRKGGLEFYHYGYQWETDGNTVITVDASAANTYQASNGETYEAGDGKIYIMVECRAKFAKDWSFSDESYLHPRVVSDPINYIIMWDKIGDAIADGYDSYVLLFCIDEASYSGDVTDYTMELMIQKSDTVQRFQNFTLQPPVER